MITTQPKKASYDFYLIIATTVVLAIISSICIWGMFYFKMAQIHEMAPVAKIAWQNQMNTIISPFIVGLIVLLGICVPKRLLSVVWLNRFAVLLIMTTLLFSWLFSVTTGLLVILCASLALQLIILVMALTGSEKLHFETRTYWSRVGSSLIHLGLILFILDLFLHRYQTLHLLLFWVTTLATMVGMVCCFYAESVAKFFKANFTLTLPKEGNKDE